MSAIFFCNKHLWLILKVSFHLTQNKILTKINKIAIIIFMSELLAQGPEFARDNISIVPDEDTVDKAADALLSFWRARVANDEAATREAQKAIASFGGASLAAIQRAYQIRRGAQSVEADTVIVDTPVQSLADLHFKAMEHGDEDAMRELESQMLKDTK